MKNRRLVLLSLLLGTILPVLIPSTKAHAYDYAPSAILQQVQTTPKITQNLGQDKRAKILQAYLTTYNSPLAPYAKTFVEEADKNNLDWRLVAAISGVESYFGEYIPSSSYNGWGFGVYGTNIRRFDSWDDGIKTLSSALRNDYMDKWKAQNVYQIGQHYAADPLWGSKVTHFLSDIEDFTKNSQDPKDSLSISL